MASYAFRITGIAPTDSQWHTAGDDVHRSFWREVVRLVLIEKDRELAAGLDRHGRKMFRISAATRRRGRWRSHTGLGTADNPPLDPAAELSRTRSLFTGRAHADHAEFFWKYDEVSHQHWGKILGYHRAGSERLPIRDVIGLSPVSLGRVQRGADKWWADWKRGHAMLARVEQVAVVVPPKAGRPIPPRAKIVNTDDPFKYSTFGIGGSEAAVRKAYAEGKFKISPKMGSGPAPPAPPVVPPAPPPKPKPPTRPRPVPWVHPPRPIPGRPGRVPVVKAPWVNPYDTMPKLNPVAHERAPITRPVPDATITAPAPHGVDLASFAAKVQAVSASVGAEGRFGVKKVFISHAYAAFLKVHEPMTLEEFKRLLGLAVQKRFVDMTRADLVEAMDEADVKASLTWHPAGGAEYHFIRTNK